MAQKALAEHADHAEPGKSLNKKADIALLWQKDAERKVCIALQGRGLTKVLRESFVPCCISRCKAPIKLVVKLVVANSYNLCFSLSPAPVPLYLFFVVLNR